MVKALTKKLLRDLWMLKSQVFTIALVVASGISVLIASVSTYESLQFAQSSFYNQYHFAEIFADLKSAPNHFSQKLREIPGISQVETRIVYDAILDLPDLKEPASGRFVSYSNDTARLNQLYLEQGRWLDPNRPDEILTSVSFANAHHYKLGDKITAILNGHRQVLQIVGIVLSPEYVYSIQANSLLPDNARFGIFWMNQNALAAATGMQGAFNNIILTLAPYANEQDVINAVERIMLPYGLLAAYNRSDQISDRFVSNEIKQQKILATSIPPIFLIVAAFLLHMVTGRLVGKQREQIATLKSLGYSGWSIGFYYLKFVFVIVILGSIIGTLLGLWFGHGMTDLYTEYFRFPIFYYHLSLWVPILSIIFSFFAASAGALGAVYQVVSLAPAQAMRPPSPTQYRLFFFEHGKLFRRLSPSTKIILRYLFRKPFRTLSVSIGIGLSVAIVILGLFWGDAVHYIIDNQFLYSQREDALITFTKPVDNSALIELQRMREVLMTEGYRSVAVRFKYQHYTTLGSLMGLPAYAKLKLLLNSISKPMPVPLHAMLLSETLANQLHVKVGDDVNIEILEGNRAKTRLKIAGIVSDYIGASAYADISMVNQLLAEDRNITSVGILTDKYFTNSLYANLKQFPSISNVAVKNLVIRAFEETFAKHILVFTSFLAAFAIIIAIGVIYNTARITLAERAWELATLRVLGFTVGEVSKILLGGIALEIAIGIPLGLFIGYFLAKFALYWMQTDWFKIPFIIDSKTYMTAALITFFAGIVSALIVQNRVKQLDLVSVLKVID